jgi:hypothetical protein
MLMSTARYSLSSCPANVFRLVCAVNRSHVAVVVILLLYWNTSSDMLVPISSIPLAIAHISNAPALQDVCKVM